MPVLARTSRNTQMVEWDSNVAKEFFSEFGFLFDSYVN